MTENDFAVIIGETKRVVLSAIEKHLAPRFYHAIDDVAQETYLRAYRSLVKQKFRGDSKIQTWLYAIARNESLRMNSKLVREENKIQKHKEEILTGFPSDNADTADDIRELHDKVAQLPDKYGSVLQLFSQGYSEKEIAANLGLKSGTVKSRISRGKEMLVKIYQGGSV